tara:strand:+ start:771 stop:995 length:225 start_codon:yes stop_codon:yes gene_type:complete
MIFIVIIKSNEVLNMTINQTLTIHELADYLHVHPNTIYKFVREERIPFIKVGKGYRFFKDEVIRALKTNAVGNG